MGLVKNFSHSVSCYFDLLTVTFALQKLLSLLIVDLSVYATGVIFRKCSPVLRYWRLLSTFSSISFSVTGFMLMSLIHFDLSFEHGNRYGSIFILLQIDIQLCQHHLLKMLSFFPLSAFGFFVKNQMFIGVGLCQHLWFDSIDPHVCF